MPAMDACTPEAIVASHTTRVVSTYGQVRQTPRRASRARATTPARATASATRSMEWA